MSKLQAHQNVKGLSWNAPWQGISLKYGVQLVNDKAESVFNYVGLENIESWTGRLTKKNDGLAEEDAATANKFYRGNVLFGKLRPYLAKAFVAEENGCCTSELLVFRPIEYDSNYLKYLVLSKDFVNLVNASTYGVKMPRASWEFIGNILIPKPPLSFQQAIASFLDRKTAAIDTLIAKKQRLIQLLEEKRTALINQAVTKGLNPNAQMKDSGIPWIGEIPVHWKVSRLGFISTKIQTGPFGSQLHASDYVDNEIPVINPVNLQYGNIVADYQKTVDEEIALRLSRYKLQIGDLVFARRGELGRCGVVDQNSNAWLCGTGCIQARINKSKAYPNYLKLFVSTPWVASWLSLESVGSTMDNLNTEILAMLPILLPPKEEQIEIFQHIKLKIHLFEQLITTIERHIQKLQEYHQSLITAAVTGKIDLNLEVAA